MHSLPEAQALLMGALLGRNDGRAAIALLRETPAIGAERRLRIYRNHLFTSLAAALAAVYPVVERLVGEPFFAATARAYIAAHPSRSGALLEFGDAFAGFLRGHAPVAALPYLADVAALEWACHEVYHAADANPLEPGRLADVPAAAQARLRLHPAPASRFVSSAFPVLRIWQANQDGDDAGAGAVSLDEGGIALLVARRDGEIEFRTLSRGELFWLRALAEGRELADAVDGALQIEPGFDLPAALARHLALGTFSAWSIAPGDGREARPA